MKLGPDELQKTNNIDSQRVSASGSSYCEKALCFFYIVKLKAEVTSVVLTLIQSVDLRPKEIHMMMGLQTLCGLTHVLTVLKNRILLKRKYPQSDCKTEMYGHAEI